MINLLVVRVTIDSCSRPEAQVSYCLDVDGMFFVTYLHCLSLFLQMLRGLNTERGLVKNLEIDAYDRKQPTLAFRSCSDVQTW